MRSAVDDRELPPSESLEMMTCPIAVGMTTAASTSPGTMYGLSSRHWPSTIMASTPMSTMKKPDPAAVTIMPPSSSISFQIGARTTRAARMTRPRMNDMNDGSSANQPLDLYSHEP